MGDTLLDGLSFSQADSYGYLTAIHPSSDGHKSAVAEAFKVKTVGAKYKLTRAVFYVRKVGNPTGHLIAKLYNMTGIYGSTGKPTGSALASSAYVNFNEIGGGSQKTFAFVGANQVELLKDHTYCIAVLISDGNVDIYNYIQVASVTDPSLHDGNGAHFKQGSWSED